MLSFSAIGLSVYFMNSLCVHLFAHQLACVNKGRHFKTDRRIFMDIFVISYSCPCLLAESLPMDEKSPSWILVVKK